MISNVIGGIEPRGTISEKRAKYTVGLFLFGDSPSENFPLANVPQLNGRVIKLLNYLVSLVRVRLQGATALRMSLHTYTHARACVKGYD